MKLLITTLTLLYFITSSVSWGVTKKDLVNENGIYYSKSSDIPFTGNVTLKTCESNEPHCKELVNLKNGKKDGSWITYHSNGQLASQGNYKNNRKDGAWIEYHSNGSLKGKYVYKDNYVNGLQEFYWDDGQLRSRCIIKNKGRDQHCIGYKKDGSLWKEIAGEFKHGIRISNNPLN